MNIFLYIKMAPESLLLDGGKTRRSQKKAGTKKVTKRKSGVKRSGTKKAGKGKKK